MILPMPRVQAAGTISLSILGNAYTQDFNTLATTGTVNTTLPTGWDLSETGTSSRNNAAYAASTGSDNAGDIYSFGASGNTERAYGGLHSGTLDPIVGASFTNNTGGTVTSLLLSYTGEQWRAGVTNRGAADRLDFQLSTNATSLTTGAWVDYDALDFNSPNTNAMAGALDGNASGNRNTISFTITGVNIPTGSSFWIRWTDFDISSSDDGLSIDDFSLTPLGSVTDTAPTVSSTVPADGAMNVSISTNLTVTFSEPVNVTDPWFSLTCATSGTHFATVSGGPTTFTLNPTADFTSSELCTLVIDATKVTDQDATDPPDTMAANFTTSFTPFDVCAQAFTPIYQIQGSGLVAAMTGTVTTKGVVIGDYEYPGSGATSNFLRGFYLQDLTGDGNPVTSDGIFVFNGNNNSVSLGDVVYVTGTAGEFQDQTQISNVTAITKCGAGSVTPVDVTFPVPSATFLEQYEGMLVRLPQTLSVTEHFQLGRFGQVVLSADGKLPQPTTIVEPGAPALAVQAQNDLNQIIVDDDSQAQDPDLILFGRSGHPLSASNTLRGGDTVTNLIGVMTYTWAGNAASGNAYRVRPINALGGEVPNFQPANPRPSLASPVDGAVRVVGMNLLNFFNTFDGASSNPPYACTLGVGGALTDCRGADDATEFARQWPKTVAAIVAMNPDVLGVNELENDGYGPDSAIQFLVDKLNAATAPGAYAFIDADTATGQLNALGTDAIKVSLLYKPDVVTPVGRTAVLNSVAFVNGGDSAPRSRPSLAQAFQVNATGAVFVVDLNHLKSKGSACDLPDQGDGQGNCNEVRTASAQELVNWLASDPTGTADPDVLLIGDYNSYAKEDPITTLTMAGYTNLIEHFLGLEAYSYVFDGQWGYLDHALGSASLIAQVSGVNEYHINADEPSVLDYNTDFKTPNLQSTLYAPDEFRVSDHDPVVVDLTPTGLQLVSLLGNGGFDNDLVHSQWIATRPNQNYLLNAPMVSPYIVPKGGVQPLQAPTGNNFVGIQNPGDNDVSGKLVHTTVAGSFPQGTVLEVTIVANRGRLAGAKTALFDTSPSQVLVQFFGWKAGSLPTINPNTDNWSRQPSVRIGQTFTNWAANGQWASQTFRFVPDRDLSYFALSIAGVNRKNASYVAFDIKQ
jgi:predicted extracellular nuclease